MAFSIFFHPDAELDLAESVAWYEEQRPMLGFSFYEDYLTIRDRLIDNPAVFPVIFGDVQRANFKKFPYSIFFEIEQDSVFIYAVFHQKRRPGAWAGRMN